MREHKVNECTAMVLGGTGAIGNPWGKHEVAGGTHRNFNGARAFQKDTCEKVHGGTHIKGVVYINERANQIRESTGWTCSQII